MARPKTHGMTGTRTFIAWNSMKMRCKTVKQYKELDIVYDPRWESFEEFYADMGDCPAGYSLDRRNNNGHYTADNCRWVTAAQQAQNMSTTVCTLEKARAIKAELAANPNRVRGYYSRLAERFGVSRFIISEIVKGNNWRTA